ncbi:hypothetical protein FDK38_003145 [Candidozyma auris]|nr:hypothetical protein FDK38_003145 [[Candida] auris]
MPEETSNVSECQHNNSLVFASDYGDQNNESNATGKGLTSRSDNSNGNGTVIPGTNDATQADVSVNDSASRNGLELGNLMTFSPTRLSQNSSSPIRYLHATREMKSMPTLETTSGHSSKSPSVLHRSASDSNAGNEQAVWPERGEHTDLADTQVIAPPPLALPNIESDTQVIKQSHIKPERLTSTPQDDKILSPRLPLYREEQDTQRIPRELNDDATQVIQKKEVVWESTQPITQVVKGSSSTHTISSSPGRINESDYNEENTTTVVLSPVDQEQEPTTQVLNTQEEIFSPEERDGISVDLSIKPVISSSQKYEKNHEQQDQYHLSVMSNEDKDERYNEIFCEDSLFQHKLKRTQADSDMEPDITEEVSQQAPLRKTTWSQSASQSITDSNPPQKVSWSPSSSDLEDISQDVSGLDLDLLKRKSSESIMLSQDNYDESREHINVPKKRKINHIASQSQIQSANGISAEESTVIEIEDITDVDAVWAFYQFRYFPAKIIQAIDSIHTLVEFTDCQKKLKNSDLYYLDVRIGDVVRTLKGPAEYVVTRMATTQDDYPLKSLRGYDTLYLSKKGKHNIASGTEVPESLLNCYMEVDDWVMHQSRFQVMFQGIDLVQNDYGAVSQTLSRRSAISTPTKPKGLAQQEPKFRSPRKQKAMKGSTEDAQTFKECVFFITSMASDRKRRLTSIIKEHGGTVFETELRRLVSFEVSSTYHLKISSQRFTDMKFGAFLSDGHSRSAKYLQALALGWPILADSFIEQAIEDLDLLQNWQAFLLPAGRSMYTKNLKSQDIFNFRMNIDQGYDLNMQFGNHSGLMATTNILIYRKRQDRQTIDMCEFIFHAFGAQTLQTFDSEENLSFHIKENTDMNFLVLDNNDNEIMRRFDGRKTRSGFSKTDEYVTFGIIDWEWVVQCTISSFVWPPIAYGVSKY